MRRITEECRGGSQSSKMIHNRERRIFMQFSKAKTSEEHIQISFSLSTIASSLLAVCNEG